MGVSSLVIVVFIAASLGLSWISGDKEQERLYDRVAKRGVETKDVERELGDRNRQLSRQTKELKRVKSKLKNELRAKKKVERKLAYEKRQRRMANERLEEAANGSKAVESSATSGTANGKEAIEKTVHTATERVDREKIRAEVEKKVKQEISELETKLRAVEEHSKRLEAEMQLKVEEGARKRAEEAWTQAELARVKAEDAAAESLKLKSRLDRVKKAKDAVDLALSEQEDALIRAEERLAKERMEREKLEEKLSSATGALDVSKAEGVEAIESASTALKAAEEAVSVVRIPQEVASRAEEIANLDAARSDAQKGLNAKSKEISLLRSRINEIESEKEIISNEALGNSNRLIALKQQLEMVKLKESELRETLEEQKAAYAAKIENAAADKEKSLKAAHAATIAELEAELESASRRLSEMSTQVPALKTELEGVRVKEAELSAKLEEQKSTQEFELVKALGEQKLSFKKVYDERLAMLESEFADASIAKLEVGKAVDTEVARLKDRNLELVEQNRTLSSMLRDSRIALAEAAAEREVAKELIAKNVALEAKLKEAGLANLQGKASDFVAQKLIERNADLEEKLQVARLGLAKSEAARERAEELVAENSTLVSKLHNADVSLAAYEGSTDIVEQITSRNTELEAKIVEAEAALAQADAARFMVEELNSKNIELNEMLAREREAGTHGSGLEAKLRNVNSALEQKLQEERGIRSSIEVKLVEAMEAKSAGETAIGSLVKLQSSAEQNLQMELEAKKELEKALVLTESKLSLSEQSVEDAVKAMREAEELLMTVRTESMSQGAVIVERGNADVTAALVVANKSRVELESKLATQMETGRIVEAKLRTFEETVGEQRATIKSLEEAVADAEARLESKLRVREEIEADIKSVGAKVLNIGAESGSEISLSALQGEFTKLKGKIRQKLESGEIEADDLIKMMRVEGVFDMHIVSRGDTLWGIASDKEHYANPYMWPLIYRYNVSKLRNPDSIEPGQVLLIFKEVSMAEAGDAIKKAKYRGDWRGWSAEQRKSWVEGWTRH